MRKRIILKEYKRMKIAKQATAVVLVVFAALHGVAATAQTIVTNYNPGANYLSAAHPDWPPLPAPPDAGIEVFQLGEALFLMDDRNWKYPDPPPPPTNPPAVAKPPLLIDTNGLLARLGSESGKAAMRPGSAARMLDSQLSSTRESVERHPDEWVHGAMLKAYEHIKEESLRTNANHPVAFVFYIDKTNFFLSDTNILLRRPDLIPRFKADFRKQREIYEEIIRNDPTTERFDNVPEAVMRAVDALARTNNTNK